MRRAPLRSGAPLEGSGIAAGRRDRLLRERPAEASAWMVGAGGFAVPAWRHGASVRNARMTASPAGRFSAAFRTAVLEGAQRGAAS